MALRKLTTRRFIQKPHRPRAFTLLEILAVISILAILTAAVTWSLQPRLQLAQMNDLLDRLSAVDHRARGLAERSGRSVFLNVDLRKNRIRIQDDDSPVAATVRLPRGFSFGQIRHDDKTRRTGQLQIPISRNGQSATWGVQVLGPAGLQRWLIVAGMTGQVLARKETRDANAIFALE